ncbi:hypothetical protein K9N08_01360 [Candidatus Gracilibacteria bacterium]|nr:hypothetical protein [Candidatus Gracilibacteria bacterium]MCF7856189.1 hypothetical protein [Candidatus Gracilibacteria bacterium]MCF7896461.1 hypothetical protein [Candidatus Gracilibacteria bacterium]
MNTSRLTTNLDPSLISFITKQASALNKTKREILEQAISFYKKEIKSRKISQGYKQMGEDQTEMNEWLSIANHPSNL